jgi:hypothetical protein
MKNFFLNALKSFMYLCFILSTVSILAFFVEAMKDFDNGSSLYYHQQTPLLNLEFLEKIQDFLKDVPFSLIIFLFSTLFGFLIRDFLKKHDY